MSSPSADDTEPPIRILWRLRDELGHAVDDQRWDEAKALADQICKLIRLALDPSKCQIGKPSLDGVFTIGTMRYERGPGSAVRAINKMNRILKTAKNNIPKR